MTQPFIELDVTIIQAQIDAAAKEGTLHAYIGTLFTSPHPYDSSRLYPVVRHLGQLIDIGDEERVTTVLDAAQEYGQIGRLLLADAYILRPENNGDGVLFKPKLIPNAPYYFNVTGLIQTALHKGKENLAINLLDRLEETEQFITAFAFSLEKLQQKALAQGHVQFLEKLVALTEKHLSNPSTEVGAINDGNHYPTVETHRTFHLKKWNEAQGTETLSLADLYLYSRYSSEYPPFTLPISGGHVDALNHVIARMEANPDIWRPIVTDWYIKRKLASFIATKPTEKNGRHPKDIEEIEAQIRLHDSMISSTFNDTQKYIDAWIKGDLDDIDITCEFAEIIDEDAELRQLYGYLLAPAKAEEKRLKDLRWQDIVSDLRQETERNSVPRRVPPLVAAFEKAKARRLEDPESMPSAPQSTENITSQNYSGESVFEDIRRYCKGGKVEELQGALEVVNTDENLDELASLRAWHKENVIKKYIREERDEHPETAYLISNTCAPEGFFTTIEKLEKRLTQYEKQLEATEKEDPEDVRYHEEKVDVVRKYISRAKEAEEHVDSLSLEGLTAEIMTAAKVNLVNCTLKRALNNADTKQIRTLLELAENEPDVQKTIRWVIETKTPMFMRVIFSQASSTGTIDPPTSWPELCADLNNACREVDAPKFQVKTDHDLALC